MSATKMREWMKSFRVRAGAAVLAAAVAFGLDPTAVASRIARPKHAISTAASAVRTGVVAATSTVERTLSPATTATALNAAEHVAEALFSSKVPFGDIIWREARKNALAPELVAAVVKQESRFRPSARSSRGALGLMQLLPATGRWMGAKNLMNPEQNIAAGARYLRYLTDEFGGNEKAVIAAYNAGDGNVRRFGGLPPFHETRTYVKNVLQFRDEFHNALAAAAAAGVGS